MRERLPWRRRLDQWSCLPTCSSTSNERRRTPPISACKVPGACDERRPVSDCSRAPQLGERAVRTGISRRLRRKSKSLYARGARRCDGGRATGAPGIFGCEADAHTLRARTVQHGVVAERQEPMGPCYLWFSVCPLAAVRCGSRGRSHGLGPFQQMRMLDEMDYQWRALLARAKKLGGRTAEVRWNHTIDATAIGVVVNEIARLQDGRASKSKAYRVAEVPHAKPHVAHADAQWKFDSWAEAQQAEYDSSSPHHHRPTDH